MSSLEEERLIQMVHDFIESETPAIPTSTPLCQDYTCLILEEILGNSTDTEKEILDKAMKYVREIGSEKSRGSAKKRLMMRLRMDGCDASLCRSSWIATLDCPGGDYEYIVIMKEGDENSGASSSKLIVDVDFKAQFELARPTSTYTKLADTLPSIFVGNDEKLKKVVSLLCSAAQKSLRQNGLHIPPWRKSKYMHSKWLPCFYRANTITLTFPQYKGWANGPSRVWPASGISH